MKVILLLSVTSLLLSNVNCYKILAIMTCPSKSHNHLAKGIVDALLDAGHEVTWATPYPDQKPHPNLTFLDVSATLPLANVDMTRQPNDVNFVFKFAENITRVTANTPSVREAVVKQQFDAVVSEWFFSDTDAGYAAIQQVPWIVLGGTSMHPFVERLVDEVRSLSTVPAMMLNYPVPMNFWQRLSNVGLYCFMWFNSVWLKHSGTVGKYEEFFAPLASARGVPLPPFEEALFNVSVLFVNSHPSIAPAQSLPPNVVHIGGYHIKSHAKNPLPKDIKDLLDSSKQGVIYFSMGSVVKGTLIPEHTRNALFNIFKKLPYTVLWKFEDKLEGLPKNVHVRPWMPQAGILNHPNVKVFITHGGLLSTLEAVHYGVPLLAVPVFGDQPSNADRAERNGFAMKVPYSEHMAPALEEALNELLTNDKYYKKAKHLSKIFNNRPVPPAKLVTHYIELAIETKGAPHLRSKTFQYSWYQVWMLDILGLAVATLLAAALLVSAAAKYLLSKRKNNKTKPKKN